MCRRLAGSEKSVVNGDGIPAGVSLPIRMSEDIIENRQQYEN